MLYLIICYIDIVRAQNLRVFLPLVCELFNCMNARLLVRNSKNHPATIA